MAASDVVAFRLAFVRCEIRVMSCQDLVPGLSCLILNLHLARRNAEGMPNPVRNTGIHSPNRRSAAAARAEHALANSRSSGIGNPRGFAVGTYRPSI